MCYISAGVSGGSYFDAGTNACVDLATGSGHQKDAAEGSMRDRGEKKSGLSHDIRDKVYECSACGAESNMSCTVNGATVCAECFLTVCRQSDTPKVDAARSSIG